MNITGKKLLKNAIEPKPTPEDISGTLRKLDTFELMIEVNVKEKLGLISYLKQHIQMNHINDNKLLIHCNKTLERLINFDIWVNEFVNPTIMQIINAKKEIQKEQLLEEQRAENP